jgi:hypothetical protein
LRAVRPENAFEKNAAALAVRATSRTPLVSLSSRWTSFGRLGKPKLSAPCRLVDDDRRLVAVDDEALRVLDLGRAQGAARGLAGGGRDGDRVGRRHRDRLAARDAVAGVGLLAVELERACAGPA